MSVFKVNKDYTIIVNKDAVKLIPELRSLTQDELWYVIMVVDYIDGPLRKKPYDERKRIAKSKIFGSNSKKDLESKKIMIAMEGYKGLIFDIRYETADVFKSKVSVLQKQVLATDDFKILQGLEKTISFLQERISKIEHSLSISEQEEIEIQGQGRKLSMLEKWQRNQMEYSKHKEG